MIPSDKILGLQDLIYHLIQEQKTQLNINIKKYHVEFYNKTTFNSSLSSSGRKSPLCISIEAVKVCFFSK
jgi:hypothetical protein